MATREQPEFVPDDLIEDKEAETEALAAAITPIPEAVNPLGQIEFNANPMPENADSPVVLTEPEPKPDWQDELMKSLRVNLQEMVAQEVAKSSPVKPVGTVPVDLSNQPPATPPSFKKHYRCDANPNMQIQRLDMSALDRGERPSANPLPGEFIHFQRGHLFTDNDNDIRQIEWMKNRPAFSNDLTQTMGGNPSIYEDDGVDLYHCSQGCDYKTPSKNAWKAHMWGTHQVQVGM